MYSVSNAFKEQMKSPIQEHRITGTIGSVSFSEANIVQGSFSISNQSTDTNDVILGSCYVGQLTCEFTGINIEWGKWINKTITPTFALNLGNNTWESVPLGIYKIKEAKHTDHGVQVTAYDNMIKFDKKFRKSHFMNLSGMTNIIDQLCTDAGVVCGMSHAQIEALPNGDRTGINIYGSKGKKAEFANDITTLRDLLFWVAQTLGCFATMNRAGQLEFRPYTQNVVDTISNVHRIEGATFADYITHYIGVYFENLDDNTEDYYGYDSAALLEEIHETQDEIDADVARIYDLEAALIEWKQKLDNHECTQQEYDAAVAEINAELKPLKKELKQLLKRIDWLHNAYDNLGDDGSDMVLGANPILMDSNLTTRDNERRAVLGALNDISYTPFNVNVVCGCIYDLGDVIQFSGGLYNSENDSFGCVMSYTYTHNGGTELQGFGVDPSMVMVRNKTQKSTDRASQNATTALNENDMVFDFGDNNEIIATNKKAYNQTTVTRKFKMWEHNFNEPQGYDWAKFEVSISMPYPFVICTIPDLDHGNPRYYYLDGKWRQSKVTYVVAKLQQSVGDRFYLSGQSWVKYAGYFNYYNEFSNTMWKRENTLYYYSATGTGTLMYGLLDIEPDYSFNSYAELWAAMAAGTIDVPGVVPDDECVMPKESTAKQAAANAEYIADKLAGNNPSRSSETYDGNVNLMSENSMSRLSTALYNIGENAGNVMTGADGTNAGAKGLVPAPTATDNEKYLRGDGTWQTVQGGGGSTELLAPTPFIYSEDEVQIGIWIDGKPLYQRTWDFGSNISCASNTWVYVNNTTITDRAVYVNAFGTDADGTVFNCINVNYANSKIGIQNTRSSAINIRYLTVQYTKTTDTAWQGGFKAYGFTPVIYSDTEREIGVWRDGKPLYEKTVYIQNYPSSKGDFTYAHGISNLDVVWVYDGYLTGGNGSTNPLNLCRPEVALDDQFGMNVDRTNIHVKVGHDRSSIYAYVVLRYTKTTDVAGSGKYTTLGTPAVHYSTDEQVIGTWIDGKTLYQKTINFGALPNNTTKNVAHNISNADNIWVAGGFARNANDNFNQLVLSNTSGDWYFSVNKTNVVCSATSNRSNYSICYVTLQYTKTS